VSSELDTAWVENLRYIFGDVRELVILSGQPTCFLFDDEAKIRAAWSKLPTSL